MASTISIDTKTISQIISRLDQLTRDVKTIKSKIITKPTYGSDEWWEWSDKKAIEDIKRGRTVTIKSKKELNEFFDSLDRA